MRKKVLAATLTAVGIALILMSTVNLFLISVNRTNHMYLRMASGSMEPTFSKGDILKAELGLKACEIHAAPKDAVPPGDIIVFHSPRNPGELIVHRAVRKIIGDGTCYFKTQGDAVMHEDSWQVRESDIVGKVVEVNPPIWTYSYVFWVIILAIGIAILGVGIAIMWGGVVERRRQRVATERLKTARFCPKCGFALSSDAKFCPHCGKPLN